MPTNTKKAPAYKKETPAEESPRQRKVEFDDESKKAYFSTVDGNEVEVSCPKTKQMLNVRKLVNRHGDEELKQDEEFALRMLSLACVTKYGDADKMTYEEYEDLSIGDGILLAKCLEFFRDSFEQLSELI
jgi:hypothetical protein